MNTTATTTRQPLAQLFTLIGNFRTDAMRRADYGRDLILHALAIAATRVGCFLLTVAARARGLQGTIALATCEFEQIAADGICTEEERAHYRERLAAANTEVQALVAQLQSLVASVDTTSHSAPPARS